MSKSKSLAVVHVKEEYGYRLWVWTPRMTSEELAEWWSGLETVAPYSYPGDLPGKVEEVKNFPITDEPVWLCHLHLDVDSILISPEGSPINHAGVEVW